MLKKLLDDHQLYMTEFQHAVHVTTNSGGSTLYGQYLQAIRELYKRTRGLREAVCDDKKLDIEIKVLERDAKKEEGLEKELKEVEIVRKKAQQEESARVVKNTEREFCSFYRQSILLNKKLVKKHGELTDEVKWKLELETWHVRMREQVVVELQTQRRISHNTFELINAMPNEMRDGIILEIKNQKKLMEWYDKREYYTLDPTELDKIKIPKKELNLLKG